MCLELVPTIWRSEGLVYEIVLRFDLHAFGSHLPRFLLPFSIKLRFRHLRLRHCNIALKSGRTVAIVSCHCFLIHKFGSRMFHIMSLGHSSRPICVVTERRRKEDDAKATDEETDEKFGVDAPTLLPFSPLIYIWKLRTDSRWKLW